jgi:hypothetical protein
VETAAPGCLVERSSTYSVTYTTVIPSEEACRLADELRVEEPAFRRGTDTAANSGPLRLIGMTGTPLILRTLYGSSGIMDVSLPLIHDLSSHR